MAAQYLAALLDDTCQVDVIGSATESEAGLRLCAELRPDAVFVDINLPGKDGVSLAKQLAMLPQAPRLVFTTGNANRATDAFRLEAVDYLLKPLDPEQVTEAVNRPLAYLRPALYEGISTRTRRVVGYSLRRLNRSVSPKRRKYKTNSNQLINRLVMIIRSNTKSIYYPLPGQKSNLIHGNRRIRYVHVSYNSF